MGQLINDNIYDGYCGVYTPTKTPLASRMGASTISIPAGNYVDLNKWYFFASSIGNSSMNQYQIEMDTNLKALSLTPINSSSGTSNIGSNTQNISIGRHLNPSYPYWISGSIDELILFNRALSDNEVYSVYSYLWGWATNIENVEASHSNYHTHFENGRLALSSSEMNYSLEVYNIAGQKVFSKANCKSSESIDLAFIPNQLLFLKLKNSKGILSIIKIVSL